MPVIERATEIRAPIEAVFVAITDPRRAGEWSPHIVGIADLSAYPVVEGTTWKQTVMMAGRKAVLFCAVGRLSPPNLGVLEISGDQEGRITTTCAEELGLTRICQRLDFAAPSGLAGAMMARLACPIVSREIAGSLARLRDTLERETGGNDGSEPA